MAEKAVTPKKTAEPKPAVAKTADVRPVAPQKCGHLNRHFVNSGGEREDLACQLKKGHEGNHWAKFEHQVTDYDYRPEAKMFIAVGSHIEESEGEWSDGASIPPGEKPISADEDAARLLKALRGEHGTDDALNQRLDAEMAAQLKNRTIEIAGGKATEVGEA